MKNLTFIISLVIGIISIIIFLLVRIFKGGIPGIISKTVASFFFIVTCLLASLSSMQFFEIKTLILVGLLFGMLGDIWLDLKVTYPKDNKYWLYSGFISFMIAHLFYITAIVQISKLKIEFVFLTLIISLICSGISMSLEKLMRVNYGRYKPIIFLYATFLISTTITSLIACFKTSFTNSNLIILLFGGIFFLISDLILSVTYFGDKSKSAPIYIALNHITYYAAQYLIATSVFFLR